MSSIDNFYYESFDAIGNPFYDWERHLINLGCNSTEFSLENGGTLTQNGKIATSKFVHEYIHFLQNFATAWGAPVFTDYSLAMMKIGASSSTSDEKIIAPMAIETLTNTLLLDGIELRGKVVERLNRSSNYTSFPKNELLPLSIDISQKECAILTNGRIIAEVGVKLIREHMAHLGTQLYLSKTDGEIHLYNLKLFVEEGKEFCKKPEYWILFEYIYELNIFTNIARGIFHLAQFNLVVLNPEKAILRFLIWFEQNKTCSFDSQDFLVIVETWIKTGKETSYLKVGREQSIKHCQDIWDMTNRNREKQDFFKFSFYITDYALGNIKRNAGGETLFDTSDDFTDFNFWRRKIAEYGTGIIRYLDATLIHGSEQHTTKMAQSFYSILSASIALKKILKNRKAHCPFLDEIPICQAHFRDSDNCYKNPFLMVMNNGEGEQCLFGNGVLLLGMKDRLIFE